jgi:hypothetical protein
MLRPFCEKSIAYFTQWKEKGAKEEEAQRKKFFERLQNLLGGTKQVSGGQAFKKERFLQDLSCKCCGSFSWLRRA